MVAAAISIVFILILRETAKRWCREVGGKV